jgi:hypothetical protein
MKLPARVLLIAAVMLISIAGALGMSQLLKLLALGHI